MSQTTNFISFIREQFVKMLDDLTVEQINAVPPGFKNNLIWNLAHAISAQQAYLYGKAGLTPVADADLITDYGNGTVPKDFVDAAEIERIKQLAIFTATKLHDDVTSGVFGSYPAITITPRQIPLNNINDALEFILFHEGLHLGTAKALKAAVSN